MREQVISAKTDREWQGIPAIERAQNGRLWCSFFSGGSREPEAGNFILLTTSDDDGVTWSEPEQIVMPVGTARAYDPAPFLYPAAWLWKAASYQHSRSEGANAAPGLSERERRRAIVRYEIRARRQRKGVVSRRRTSPRRPCLFRARSRPVWSRRVTAACVLRGRDTRLK